MTRRRRHHHRRAFTLVETIVVVVLIGLLSAAVVMSFSAPVAKLRARDAVETMRMLDENARAQARRSGAAVQVVIDLSNRTLSRRDGAGETVFQTRLFSEFTIDRFRSGDEDRSSGEAIVKYSPLGLTRTYAVHLSGPGLDQWLLFAGLSGEASVIEDEATINSIFPAAAAGSAQAATGGHDAR